MFTLREIKELIRTLDASSLTHIELEREGERLVLKKDHPSASIVPAGSYTGGSTAPTYSSVPSPAPSAPQLAEGSVPSGDQTQPEAPQKTVSASPAEDQITLIKSPMVGTFYAAPNPDAPPYVNVGDTVKPDTVVCIIEAMKLFNEIVADVEGTIVDILVQNGTLVEYGQPLFKVRTTS
ncbi:MAG: acetyl-CoA carboxylase biotin carboxyl carrier protein [Candidatus Carbobacillus altaicus]|nr:acetyl-CoA carboxylase biotin carboxyl carrier protein [Candidatus Carbobacillus altaicus]